MNSRWKLPGVCFCGALLLCGAAADCAQRSFSETEWGKAVGAWQAEATGLLAYFAELARNAEVGDEPRQTAIAIIGGLRMEATRKFLLANFETALPVGDRFFDNDHLRVWPCAFALSKDNFTAAMSVLPHLRRETNESRLALWYWVFDNTMYGLAEKWLRYEAGKHPGLRQKFTALSALGEYRGLDNKNIDWRAMHLGAHLKRVSKEWEPREAVLKQGGLIAELEKEGPYRWYGIFLKFKQKQDRIIAELKAILTDAKGSGSERQKAAELLAGIGTKKETATILLDNISLRVRVKKADAGEETVEIRPCVEALRGMKWAIFPAVFDYLAGERTPEQLARLADVLEGGIGVELASVLLRAYAEGRDNPNLELLQTMLARRMKKGGSGEKK